jgi:endonuclease YncB( thermonuclease family)
MSLKLKFIISVLFAILISAFSTAAQVNLSGKVIDVIDGKTVVIEIPSGKFEAKLQYIETPTREQAMFETVKQHLKNLVLGKFVSYRARTISYEGSTGKLTLNDTDISEQMLRDGAAWHIPVRFTAQQSDEHVRYASQEAAAKKENRGIWAIMGLKPSWDNSGDTTQSVFTPKTQTRSVGKWGDKNPKLGDVGALLNGYSAESKTGYLSTSPLGLAVPVTTDGNTARIYVDVSYFYKEDDKKGRTGFFVVSLVFDSKNPQFLRQNNLVLLCDGKRTNVGQPKRTMSKQPGYTREFLHYRVNKSVVRTMANEGDVYLLVGNHYIYLTGMRYMLYNMLQVAE